MEERVHFMSTENSSSGKPELLRVSGITKIFGSLKANDHVSLKVGRGEIHSLLGENGAGKSTLVKMLFGSLQPTSGEIFWNGKPVTIANPAAARRLGIGMVFQHFSLFEALTAAENIALSLDRTTPISQIAERAKALSEAYGLPLDPQALVGDLSVGERQRIEIIRCLLQEPQLIILDEPTSVLTPQEADKMFVTLERLRDEGKSILYISHRLNEVKRLCDAATVLRHGKVVGDCNPQVETASSLARMMVGNDIASVSRAATAAHGSGKVLMSLKNLNQPPAGPFSTSLKDISIDLKAGEIVGVAGVAGNGQGEFFDAVSGEVTQADAGSITINGKPVGNLGVNARRLMGASFIPEERLGHGAVPGMKLSENLLLSRVVTDARAYMKGGPLKLVNSDVIAHTTKRISQDMDVRKSAEDPEASALSGGNLQKFLVGRELDRSPSILVINQPTWGVDAGAAARIRQSVIDLARSGSAVLVISQDLDELFEISDFIAVMNHGRLSPPKPAAETTLEQIGLLMGGAAA